MRRDCREGNRGDEKGLLGCERIQVREDFQSKLTGEKPVPVQLQGYLEATCPQIVPPRLFRVRIPVVLPQHAAGPFAVPCGAMGLSDWPEGTP